MSSSFWRRAGSIREVDDLFALGDARVPVLFAVFAADRLVNLWTRASLWCRRGFWRRFSESVSDNSCELRQKQSWKITSDQTFAK